LSSLAVISVYESRIRECLGTPASKYSI
jgi:hypothetical protein